MMNEGWRKITAYVVFNTAQQVFHHTELEVNLLHMSIFSNMRTGEAHVFKGSVTKPPNRAVIRNFGDNVKSTC